MRRFALLTIAVSMTFAACGDDSGVTSGTAAGQGAVAGCAAADGSSPRTDTFTEYPPDCLEEGAQYRATIETNHGTLHVLLRSDIAPLAVNSFVNLARFHYFDGTTCHRAIQYFVVQCGDPTATGRGGPGYEFADELDLIEPYRIGSVAMANAGPNTNGSQFFIITGDNGATLDPNYTLFGEVEDDDLGVVAALDAIGNPGDGPPLEPIEVISVLIDEV